MEMAMSPGVYEREQEGPNAQPFYSDLSARQIQVPKTIGNPRTYILEVMFIWTTKNVH